MGNAVAQDVSVLSAGAVEPGLRAALALYEKKTAVTFNTAPQIRERVEKKGEKFDVVIVPPAVMDAFAEAGRVEPDRVPARARWPGDRGAPRRAGAGYFQRRGLKRALLDAESVVFNRATGGQYIESMLRKIGVYEQIEKKTTRYASARRS